MDSVVTPTEPFDPRAYDGIGGSDVGSIKPGWQRVAVSGQPAQKPRARVEPPAPKPPAKPLEAWEASLLAKILLDPSQIPAVAKAIKPADLTPKHGAIFEACIATHAGDGCDLHGVAIHLDAAGKLGWVGGTLVLAEIAEQSDTAVDAVKTARRLKRHIHTKKRSAEHVQAARDNSAPETLERIRTLDAKIEQLEKPRERLQPLTVDEILEDTVPDAVVGRLLFDGSPTLYCGLPKRGKSMSAAQLALCLASGNEFVGMQVRRSRVLYLSWELTAASLVDRMKDIAKGVGLPDPVQFIRSGWITIYAHRRKKQIAGLDLSEGNGWSDLGDLVDSSKADVLVIDTVSKVAAIQAKDDTGWAAFIANLIAFSRNKGVSILAIDHAHRQRIDDNASTVAMGAQVKGSAIPTIAKLTESKDDDPLEKRWKIEVDSWYGNDSAPVWYKRPGDVVAGNGCIETDPPDDITAETGAARCEAWISIILEALPQPKKHVVDLGTQAGFSSRAVERAFSALGGKTTKDFQGGAKWELPGQS